MRTNEECLAVTESPVKAASCYWCVNSKCMKIIFIRCLLKFLLLFWKYFLYTFLSCWVVSKVHPSNDALIGCSSSIYNKALRVQKNCTKFTTVFVQKNLTNPFRLFSVIFIGIFFLPFTIPILPLWSRVFFFFISVFNLHFNTCDFFYFLAIRDLLFFPSPINISIFFFVSVSFFPFPSLSFPFFPSLPHSVHSGFTCFYSTY